MMVEIVESELEPCIGIAYTSIVIGRRTEGIKLRSVALSEYCIAAIRQAIECSISQTERCIEVVAIHSDSLCILSKGDVALGVCHILNGYCLHVGSLHTQLLLHLYISLLCPRHVLALQELYLDEVFALRIELRVVVIECIFLTFARTDDVLGTHKLSVMLDALTVLPQRPYYLITAQRLKVVLVEYLDAALSHVYCLHTYVLIYLLHLKILCLRRKVGTHDTIHTEHTVVRLVVHTEVATIAPILLAGLRVDVIQCLVYPVPDGTAHKEVGAFYRIPVVNEVAYGVTH